MSLLGVPLKNELTGCASEGRVLSAGLDLGWPKQICLQDLGFGDLKE